MWQWSLFVQNPFFFLSLAFKRHTLFRFWNVYLFDILYCSWEFNFFGQIFLIHKSISSQFFFNKKYCFYFLKTNIQTRTKKKKTWIYKFIFYSHEITKSTFITLTIIYNIFFLCISIFCSKYFRFVV